MSGDVRHAYADACIRYVATERTLTEEEMAVGRERVSQLSRDLARAVRTVHAARERSKTLRGSAATDRTRRELEFDELIAMRRVSGVEVEDSMIRVLTEPLTLEHDGHAYLIGEFSLDLDLEEGDITIRNLKNTIRKGGWEHPHVQGGIPCLGNLRDGMLKLLGECELIPLTSMLIQFLESYEPETAYCAVDSWKEVMA